MIYVCVCQTDDFLACDRLHEQFVDDQEVVFFLIDKQESIEQKHTSELVELTHMLPVLTSKE
jgi:hypothetical protein